MSTKDKYTLMTTAPIPRLIGSLAVPTIISMLVTSFMSWLILILWGRLTHSRRLRSEFRSLLWLSFRLLDSFSGMGRVIIFLVSWEPKITKVQKNGIYRLFYAFMSGAIIALFGHLYLSQICVALGSTPTILPYAEEYLGTILLGAPFMASSLVLNNQMRFQGNAVYAMVGIIVGAVLNIGLDPLLIFVFDMGVSGAAWATLLSQICSFLVLLVMDSRGTNIRIRFKNFTLKPAYLKEIVFGGSPSLCRQGLASLSTILLNVAAGAYGDAAIAGMSIVTRICMFINSFVIGFGQGFQPVCGFNYGAGIYRRVREGFWFCVKTGVVFLAVCSVIGYIFSPEIVSWFRDDPHVIETGTRALRWQLITLPLGAWVILCNMMLQTIRKPVRAVTLSSARQGLFFIPFILILPHFFGLQGVEMCQAVSDLCSFLLAIPLTIPVLNEMKNKFSLPDGAGKPLRPTVRTLISVQIFLKIC